ncbi:hypothetical protein TRICI_003126 [Trichomonascus ciferrii]|uniref:Uncharacterized protein n=1 Tax=Trichomonascus ciferrii TaxID=44093 RepID=A0A642V403_9ASCO|nr:hypothetical protein TRICI_003126 [Trichomonascus ciferrii]
MNSEPISDNSDSTIPTLIAKYNLQHYTAVNTADPSSYTHQLENDLLIAGQLGKALLERQEELIKSYEAEKVQLKMEIDNLKSQIDILFKQNQQLLQNNDELLTQSYEINQSIISSDNRLVELNDDVSNINKLRSKLSYYMSQSTTLETEISLLERSRDDLEKLVEDKDKENGSIQTKYNKTSRLLDDLIVQYQDLEESMVESQKKNSFISSIMSENSRLHRTVQALNDQLNASKNEVIQLKNQIHRKPSTISSVSTIEYVADQRHENLDDFEEEDDESSYDHDISYSSVNDSSRISDDTEITIPPSPDPNDDYYSHPNHYYVSFSPSRKSIASSNISIKSGMSMPETLKKPSEPSALSNPCAELSVACAVPPQTVTNKSSSKDLLFAAVSNNTNINSQSLKRKPSNWSSWLRINR